MASSARCKGLHKQGKVLRFRSDVPRLPSQLRQNARQRTEIRHQGKYRVARELRARGVQDHHIETAIAEASATTDESAQVRQRIDRKLKFLRGEIDDRKIASLYRSLLRAGFSSDTIRRELKRATTEDLPEIESPDESA